MILVAGGTGRLGTLVVAGLTARGERVRVLTRNADRAMGLVGPLVEVVQGDVRDHRSLEPAVAGTRIVVSAVHGFAGPGQVTPASVDRDGNANLVSAAKAANADVVLVSGVGAAADHPMELFRMKAAAEHNLRSSGVPWTIIRATAFLELYLNLMRDTAGKSGRPLIFGRGENPINFVSVTAVAHAVVIAVLDPSQRGRTIEVIGARNLTLNELAGMAQQDLGTADRGPRHVPRGALHLLAASRIIAKSAIARKADAALVMDTVDMRATADHGGSFETPPFGSPGPSDQPPPDTRTPGGARSVSPSAAC